MVAKVMIDRKIKEGKESDFFKLLKELRAKAIAAPGYISGETLQAMNDSHHYVVISTWQGVDEWKNWENNPQRKEITDQIEKLVSKPTGVNICVHTLM